MQLKWQRQLLFLVFGLFVVGIFSNFVPPTNGWVEYFSNSNYEIIEEIELPVKGEIPKWVEGTMISNGPARFDIGNVSFTSIFDGFAKLHRWRLHKGKVLFNARFLESWTYQKGIKENKIIPSLYMADLDPCITLFGRLQALWTNFHPSNLNVNVWKFGDHFVATSDIAPLFEFDEKSLQSFGMRDYNDNMGTSTYYRMQQASSHMHMLNGSTIGIVQTPSLFYFLGMKGSLKVWKAGDDMIRHSVAEIKLSYLPYIHSFSITQNKAIIFAYPMQVHLFNILEKPTIMNMLHWEKSFPTEIFVVDLLEREPIKKYQTSACFSFHHINAFEDKENIYVDINAINEEDPLIAFRWGNLERMRYDHIQYKIEARRYKIPKDNSEPVTFSILSPVSFALPRINEKYRGESYCFIWAIELIPPSIVKIDICNNHSIKRQEKDQIYAEPIFVPSPTSTKEDDGIILSNTYDGITKRNYLLMLNASTLEPIARAFAPIKIPFTFHGQFFT